jgi:hypothetical protein
VEIELTEVVSSSNAKPDDRFAIRLARDVTFGGQMLIPKGAEGTGQVVDCAPAGLAGRPGKLILAARSIDYGPVHLPLRSFKLSGSGRDDSKTAIALTATPYVGILAIGIQGGNIDYPAGVRAIAKVAADTMIAPISTDPKVAADIPPSPSPASASASRPKDQTP